MSSLKETVDYRNVEKTLRQSTRKAWLAGLGVLSTVEEEGVTLLNQLIERGRKVEARGKKRLSQTRKEFESTTDQLTEKIDERVANVVQRMGVPSRAQVEKLTARVEKLVGQVERLSVPTKESAASPRAKKATGSKSKAA